MATDLKQCTMKTASIKNITCVIVVSLYLLGVNRRELVGGPPAFSLAADRDMELFMFSLSSCGPLRLGSGVCGVEVC